MASPVLPAAAPAAPAGPPKVLVADDDPQMRRLIRGVLQRDGFEVVEAGDGLDALEAVEKGVDLVILDVDMPRLDGLGVLEELRAQVRTACLPVIVLDRTARRDRAKGLGSRGERLPQQAGSDPLTRGPGAGGPQARKLLNHSVLPT